MPVDGGLLGGDRQVGKFLGTPVSFLANVMSNPVTISLG